MFYFQIIKLSAYSNLILNFFVKSKHKAQKNDSLIIVFIIRPVLFFT